MRPSCVSSPSFPFLPFPFFLVLPVVVAAALLIVVVSVSWLFAALVSSMLASEAVLEAVPEFEALTTIEMLALVALFTWPRLQVTLEPDLVQVPADGVADT